MAIRTAFDENDLRALLRGPTDDERAAVAHRLCRRIDAGISEAERGAAAEVLRLMAADAAEVVRRALAVTLKASSELPRDVALKLAADVESIAVPVLSFSPAFSDADLAEIVAATGDATRQVAVAGRAVLGEAVAKALAVHGCEAAVTVAISNDNAHFTGDALSDALERFPKSAAITAGMAYRKVLPPAIAERLVDLVSEEVRRRLVDRHQLSAETALRIATATQERATVDLVEQAGRAADLPAFCAHLHRQERLTASLILRALTAGHMAFVESAFAELAGIPHHRAWLLVHDAGPLGLRALYERTELPPRLLPAIRAGIDTHRALLNEGVDDPAVFQSRLLQRFLTQPQGAPKEDVDYLIDRMDRLVRVERGGSARVRGAA